MSFFHSNLGFWSKLLIMGLDSISLAYSTQISSNQYRMTTVVSYVFTSSSFLDSASTATLSFPFLCIISISKVESFSIHFCCSVDNVYFLSKYWRLL
jgi:hypothetical protein